MDSRVSSDASSVPYGYEIFEDKAFNYELDTDITVTRAINPGSVDNVDQISQTQSSHGIGIKSYSVSRG